MGWEERNGNLYYYEKERTADGRVVSKYIGKGEFARLVGQMTMGRRAERKQNQWRFEREKATHRAQRHALDNVQEVIRAVEGAVLLLNGYHTHKGQWRRQRAASCADPSSSSTPDADFDMSTEKNVHEIELKESDREFVDLLKRMDTGDPARKDRLALRKILRETPGLWRRIFSAVRYNEDQIVAAMTGKNGLLTESLRHGIREMKADLGHEDAPVLERLLIDQVALTWLHFQETQRRYTNHTSGQYRFSEAEHWEKRVNAAQRRYLRAVKTLARVRKMAGREVLQINIGGQHVNVAG